jgi:hypothetical protein
MSSAYNHKLPTVNIHKVVEEEGKEKEQINDKRWFEEIIFMYSGIELHTKCIYGLTPNSYLYL